MDKQEHRTNVNDRVVIKGTVTHMYPDARAYGEAVVKKRMHDHLGYPLIYIEWDKDHWAYSGEEDRWVLESHFEPVKESMSEKNDDLLRALTDLVKNFQSESDGSEEKIENKVDTDPVPISYEDILSKGFEDALDGEAFILFVAAPEEYQGAHLVMPHIYADSKNEEAALLNELMVSEYVAQAFSRLVAERAKQDGSSGQEER